MDLSHLASDQFRLNFPQLAARFDNVSKINEETYGIKPLFGYWYNLCVNAPRFSWHNEKGGDTQDVICAPHIDAENWAVYLCCIFIYSLEGIFQLSVSAVCRFIPEF